MAADNQVMKEMHMQSFSEIKIINLIQRMFAINQYIQFHE